MEHLWTPWRHAYVTGQGRGSRKGVPEELSGWPPEQDMGCVFCNMIAAVRWAAASGMRLEEAERAALVLEQGRDCFICLNRYPYSTGHLMIVPYLHADSLVKLSEAATAEMMSAARRMELVIREVYSPDGLNFGINLGEAAGAGVAEHLHLHELPRWKGDTNFMTVTAETRVIPEVLTVTWERLRIMITNAQLMADEKHLISEIE